MRDSCLSEVGIKRTEMEEVVADCKTSGEVLLLILAISVLQKFHADLSALHPASQQDQFIAYSRPLSACL